jgi:hypothetical protein
MKKIVILPVLAAVMFAGACGEDGPTIVTPAANVRFLNATTGMTGSGGFTANGQFANGSALTSGQSNQTCSKVNVGATSFAFGAANAGGTGLSGNALTTLSNQSLTDGGDYIVAATGSATSPTLFLLDNKFPGTLASNQAAVRFVNLAPGTGTTRNTFVVWMPELAPGVGPTALNMAAGAPTEYKTVTPGANTYTVMQDPGHNIVIPSGTVTLQAGSVNTLGIVPGTAAGTFQVIHMPGC